MKTKTSSFRLQYLDWVRGIGAIIMLQGHVFDSFTKNEYRPGGAYLLSQFVGGMPPAIFLFLTGVTLAFLMDSTERKGLPPLERLTTSLRRAGYLFVLAFAFRLQLWLFGWPASAWQDLLRVDILNCMGFSIAVFSVMALFRNDGASPLVRHPGSGDSLRVAADFADGLVGGAGGNARPTWCPTTGFSASSRGGPTWPSG